jgi:hypothetical protein
MLRAGYTLFSKAVNVMAVEKRGCFYRAGAKVVC